MAEQYYHRKMYIIIAITLLYWLSIGTIQIPIGI